MTGQVVKLLEGHYGPYVADGETNASLPKGAEPESLTFEQALELLAERAAKGGGKKKKKAAKKKVAKATKAAKKTPAEGKPANAAAKKAAKKKA